MNVSTRNTLLACAAATALFVPSGVALGQAVCPGGCGPAPVNPGPLLPTGPAVIVPGLGGATPSGTPQTGPGCCDTPSGVNLPGVTLGAPNIVVSTPNTNVGVTSIQTQGFLQQQKQQQFSNRRYNVVGGGGFVASTPATPARELMLEGQPEQYTETITEQVPVTEEYCVDQVSYVSKLRPVRADCLDDKGTPHPASQVSGEKQVSAKYAGEVYRCMAGTYMQVTLGQMNGSQADFSKAESFSCAKGEALVHRAGGDLSCAPQAPQRNCNERSLLRRNGPGMKLINLRREAKVCVPQNRTVMKSVSRQVQRTRATAPTRIQLNGGVGNGLN
ncbi:MAG: hypothetical protein ACRBEQ_02225 [Hyphomonas sp.]